MLGSSQVGALTMKRRGLSAQDTVIKVVGAVAGIVIEEHCGGSLQQQRNTCFIVFDGWIQADDIDLTRSLADALDHAQPVV